MKNFNVSLLLILALFFQINHLSAQWIKGNGKVATETRNASNFSAVNASGAFNVFISQKNEFAVVVEADENLMEYIETEVRGGSLYIKAKKNFRDTKELNVYIVMPKIKGLHSSGASDIIAEEAISANDLDLKSSGSSDIKLDAVNAESVSVSCSGSSDIVVYSGEAEDLSVSLSGSSDFKGHGLKTSSAYVKTSGASDALIHVTQSLEAHASGASDIKCKGNPRNRDTHSSGAADVIFME